MKASLEVYYLGNSNMQNDAFFRLAQKYFGYLLTEDGFSLVNETERVQQHDAALVMQSSSWCIRIWLDRCEVYLDLAPRMSDEQCWIDLGTVIDYLAGSTADRTYDIHVPREGSKVERLEAQFRELAALLRTYYPQVSNLFTRAEPSRLCRELQESGIQRLRQRARLGDEQ